jgi:hypothetical protein
MRTARQLLSLFLCAAISSVAFAAEKPDKQISYGVKYAGGSFPTVKTGEDLKLFLDSDQVRLLRGDKKLDPLIVKASIVTEVSYGQDVHRRIGTAIGLAVISLGVGALMAFSKSKKHFIGLVWDDGNGTKGGLVVQADKNEYRGLLAAIEGLTGKKAVDTDNGKPNS